MEKLKIVIATNNEHKIKEYRDLFNDLNVELMSLKEASLTLDAEESGKTFKENAIIKAKAVQDKTDAIVLSDDSGLEIDYLLGFPGIHSARFLSNYPQKEKNQAILDLMKETNERSARFRCAIALANFKKDEILVFEGTEEGKIACSPSGNNGFGYDPIFISSTFNRPYAELTEEEKNQVSHRSRALRKLIDELFIDYKK